MIIRKQDYYAIKIIVFFAFSKKTNFSIKEVSGRTGISDKVLEQILLGLKNAGILNSKRGPQGGYTLRRDVSDLTIKDIIDLTGNPIGVFPVEIDEQRRATDIVLSEMDSELKKIINKQLNTVKVGDLTGKMKGIVNKDGLSYSI